MAKPDTASMPLDDVSKAIIEQLQRDGRAPYASIGKAVGLSEAAVRQRVQRMLDAGVVQVVAVSNPMQLGFTRAAMIGLNVDGSMEAVAERIAKMPEIDYVVITAGSFDLLCEVVCENDEQLLSILQDRLRAIPEVKETETFVYLKLLKQTYQWGTR
ncbi:MAG: Lrp/AsnC family transcriptional regulator [Candidatus Nanopelagicales bacterium]